MRITGGEYRSRQIQCPPGVIRPSMDRMRISLFSILGDISGVKFLDLFSGSGVIGIEAASRGAEPVVLVENDPGKRKTILRNISFVTTRIELLTVSVERFLRSNTTTFDVVFLDPPFDFSGKGDVLDAACREPHLHSEGLAILHLHSAEKLRTERPGLRLVDKRQYGQSLLLFFKPAAGAGEPAAPEPEPGV
jgi:16S rRNA (guanine966-N2)-methyltransferase